MIRTFIYGKENKPCFCGSSAVDDSCWASGAMLVTWKLISLAGAIEFFWEWSRVCPKRVVCALYFLCPCAAACFVLL